MALPPDVVRVLAGVALAVLHSLLSSGKPPPPPDSVHPLYSSVDCRCVCDCIPLSVTCPLIPFQPLIITVALLVIVAAALGFRLGRALPARPLSAVSSRRRDLIEESDAEEDTQTSTGPVLQAALYGAPASASEETVADIHTLAVRQAEFLRLRRTQPSRS
jgi:hypothetical protein